MQKAGEEEYVSSLLTWLRQEAIFLSRGNQDSDIEDKERMPRGGNSTEKIRQQHQISITFTDTEVNNCFSICWIISVLWVASGRKFENLSRRLLGGE